MIRYLCLVLSAGALIAAVAIGRPDAAVAQSHAGTLQCETEGGLFHFGSTRAVTCVYHPDTGRNEAYAGQVGDLHLGLRSAGAGVIVWDVFSTHSPVPYGELAGSYARAGGRQLMDGSDRTLMLRPGYTGRTFNVATGVGTLDLNPLMRAPADRTAHHRRLPAVGLASTTPGQSYGCGSYMTVRAGDTLSAIGRHCGVSLEALLRANPAIRDVRALRIGQTVSIPSHVAHHGTSSCGTHVTLHDGESIQEAAWRCGVTQHALLRANPPLRDLGGLHAGLVLALPAERDTGGAMTIVAEAPSRVVRTASAGDFADAVSGGPDLWHVVGVEPGHRLNLRAGPSVANQVVDRVGPNTTLANKGCRQVAGERWCRVAEVDGSGITGWAAGRFLAEGTGSVSHHVTPVAALSARRTVPAAAPAVTPAATGDRLERVSFARGEDSTTIEDQLRGRDGIDYRVNARAGQAMAVTLQAAGTAYFNVLAPSAEGGEAIFVGSREGSAFEQTLQEDGDYVVRLYLMGGDRDEGRTVPFRLNVSVTGAPADMDAGAAASTAAAADGSQAGAFDDGIRREVVRFAPGGSGTTIDSTVTGDEVADYVVGAAEGQIMEVGLDGSAFFNILPPGSNDVAIYNNSNTGTDFRGVLEETGNYVVRVYNMGNAEDTGRTVPFTLSIAVEPGDPMAGGAAASEESVDARVDGTAFHATGSLACELGDRGGLTCPFGVERHGNGSADVIITRPGGGERVIFFEAGEALGTDAAEASGDGRFAARREGDETIVEVGGEVYVIPDAVLYGG